MPMLARRSTRPPLLQTTPPNRLRPILASAWSRALAPRSKLNLALQGGGAHGAFTWGVLDSLLEDGRLHFEGLSGSSAGALNAVLFAEGWRRSGRDGARRALADFWSALGQQIPFEYLVKGEGENISLSSASKVMLRWAGLFSPTQLNPLGHSALRDLLNRHVDFARLRKSSPFKLFIGATQANTGKLRVFREHEASVDVLLASTCLPKLHQAVTIDGEPYWDGAYSANPAVYPLFYECRSRDVMLVLLSPLRHESAPHSAEEIEQRALELAFSANLMREMRTFQQATAFARSVWLPTGGLERRLRDMRFHMIDSQDLASMQRTETKLIAHTPFLELLHAQGRERAHAWLAEHADAVGRRATVDMNSCFG
ncbi:MAG: patatin-like phospholipase family protein [Burkholderiales bacterium]